MNLFKSLPSIKCAETVVLHKEEVVIVEDDCLVGRSFVVFDGLDAAVEGELISGCFGLARGKQDPEDDFVDEFIFGIEVV